MACCCDPEWRLIGGISSHVYDYTTRQYDASGNQVWKQRTPDTSSLTIDSEGNVYVGHGRVLASGGLPRHNLTVFSSDGGLLFRADTGTLAGTTITAMSLRESTGSLFCAQTPYVIEAGLDGNPIQASAALGVNITGIAADPAGSAVYISTLNKSGSYLWKLDADLAVEWQYNDLSTRDGSAVAIGPDGNVYVTMNAGGTGRFIAVISPDGTLVDSIFATDGPGTELHQDLAFTPGGNLVVLGQWFVGESAPFEAMDMIRVFEPGGSSYDSTPIVRIQSPYSPLSLDTELAVDSTGQILVGGHHYGTGSTHAMFSSSGSLLWTALHGSPGVVSDVAFSPDDVPHVAGDEQTT